MRRDGGDISGQMTQWMLMGEEAVDDSSESKDDKNDIQEVKDSMYVFTYF